MRRRGFLGSAVALVVGLRHGEAAGPLEVPPQDVYVGPVDVPVVYGEGQSLIMAGGLCAPLSPIYDIPSFQSERPIKDALPSFSASREERS